MTIVHAMRAIFTVVLLGAFWFPSIDSLLPRELLPKGSGFWFLYNIGIAAISLFAPLIIGGIGVILVETKQPVARIAGSALAAIGAAYMLRFAIPWVEFLSPFKNI